MENDLPKPKNAPEISKPVMKNVISEAPVSATKKVSNKIIKKSQQKVRILQLTLCIYFIVNFSSSCLFGLA